MLSGQENPENQVRFDGRAILVTGAGRGMGRAHALLLASRGAKVVVADNGGSMDGSEQNASVAQNVVDEITAAGGTAVACTVDLSTEAGSQEAVDTSIRAFGRIDAILHNASTAPNATPADKISTRDLDLVMRINPLAGYWMTRAAWPHMKQQGYGRIVYISSHSIYGAEQSTIYASAKSAYIGMMRGLAPEGAKDGILINVVMPTGATRMTARMPESEYADWLFETMLPDRMAPGVAYMVSEDCQLSGEMLSMGGGRIARITLAETRGFLGQGADIEEVRAAMPGIMSETEFFHARDLTERSAKVARIMGFDGPVGADAYAVKDLK